VIQRCCIYFASRFNSSLRDVRMIEGGEDVRLARALPRSTSSAGTRSCGQPPDLFGIIAGLVLDGRMIVGIWIRRRRIARRKRTLDRPIESGFPDPPFLLGCVVMERAIGCHVFPFGVARRSCRHRNSDQNRRQPDLKMRSGDERTGRDSAFPALLSTRLGPTGLHSTTCADGLNTNREVINKLANALARLCCISPICGFERGFRTRCRDRITGSARGARQRDAGLIEGFAGDIKSGA
jgi:hypothetical protein